jgi:hypothetical protein
VESALVVIRILHIGLAAAWFGHKLLIPMDLRETLRTIDGRDQSLLVRLQGAQRLGLITGTGTLATGVTLIVLIGPVAVSPWVFAGLTLVIAMFAVGALLARPSWNRLKASVETGDRRSARIAADALTRALNIESVVWVAVLVTMVI